jgi:hypothetical protein
MKRPCSGRRHLDVVTDLLQPADEALGGLLGVGAIEVGGTQVATEVKHPESPSALPLKGRRRWPGGEPVLRRALGGAAVMGRGWRLGAMEH